jgi:hypothetical protein
MHAQALEHKRGGRTQTALHLLKREKMTNDELASIRVLYTTVVQQQTALQQAILNADTLATVHAAAQVLREKQSSWSADRVADLVDTLEDAKDHSREIHDLLQSTTRMDVSDAELLAQLEDESSAVPHPLHLPELPALPALPVRPPEAEAAASAAATAL